MHLKQKKSGAPSSRVLTGKRSAARRRVGARDPEQGTFGRLTCAVGRPAHNEGGRAGGVPVGNLCPLLVACRAYSEIVRPRGIKDGRSWITSSTSDVVAADFGAATAAEPAFAAMAYAGIAFACARRAAAKPPAGGDSQGLTDC